MSYLRDKKIRTSLFVYLGILSLVIFWILGKQGLVFPSIFAFLVGIFFFLYPLIRFLFGGKDSIAAVATTMYIEAKALSKLSRKSIKK